MSGYIKYSESGGKNMSFLTKDDEVWEKNKEISDVIKNKLNIKSHSKPVYDKKYLKTKVREIDGEIKTNFLGNKIPKENTHYTCIACVPIESVMRIDKKIIRKFVLEECKYKIKKTKISKFKKTELEYELESESESESKSDAELITKLESDSDSK